MTPLPQASPCILQPNRLRADLVDGKTAVAVVLFVWCFHAPRCRQYSSMIRGQSTEPKTTKASLSHHPPPANTLRSVSSIQSTINRRMCTSDAITQNYLMYLLPSHNRCYLGKTFYIPNEPTNVPGGGLADHQRGLHRVRELQRVVPLLLRGARRERPPRRLLVQAVPPARRQGAEGPGGGAPPQQGQDQRLPVGDGELRVSDPDSGADTWHARSCDETFLG